MLPSTWLCLPKGILVSLLPQNLDAKQKITVSYRYISWFITSIYYLSASPYNSLRYKVVVVIALLIFSRLIMDYYLKSSAARDIQMTIIFETIGLTLLLIPTGGLESPFIWYALNPVFIASNYLKAIRGWLNLFFYLLAALLVSSSLFNTKGLSIVEILQNKSYIILVYSLITIAMRLLSRAVNQLEVQVEVLKKQRQELIEMNSKLQAAIFEHEQLEKVSTKLMILEEQNRIANEIHDNVSQRFFSILCAVHALNANWREIDDKAISKQLQLIEQSVKETSKELRVSIYRLSSSKKEENAFKETIDSYLQDFASLNSVTVKFEFHGDEEGMDNGLKQAMNRIIREATGNAVRHGKCTETLINMTLNIGILELTIKDNGQGFDSISTLENQTNHGLGLINMQKLTQTFGGIFNLSSKIGRGSELKISIPWGIPERKLQQGGAA